MNFVSQYFFCGLISVPEFQNIPRPVPEFYDRAPVFLLTEQIKQFGDPVHSALYLALLIWLVAQVFLKYFQVLLLRSYVNTPSEAVTKIPPPH